MMPYGLVLLQVVRRTTVNFSLLCRKKSNAGSGQAFISIANHDSQGAQGRIFLFIAVEILTSRNYLIS